MSPTSGGLRICGHDIQHDPLAAKPVLGYVPEEAMFYEKLTPHKFMCFTADLYQMEHA